MRNWLLAYLFLPGLLIPAYVYCQDKEPAGHFHYSFIENKGQYNEQVRFKAALPYGALFLEETALTFQFLNKQTIDQLLAFKLSGAKGPLPPHLSTSRVPAHAYRVQFLQANTKVHCRPSFPLPDYMNYFIGNDPARWASHVLHYKDVTYQDIYPGINFQLTQEAQQLKYNFYVTPGASPAAIVMEYTGIERLSLHKGKLRVQTSVNVVEELAPIAWQEAADGKHEYIRCRYHLKGNQVSFRFPDGYNPELQLVIDPVLVFSSYSGSVVDNWGYTATYDKEGYLYAGGVVFTQGYPVILGSFQVNFGGGSSDIAISKYDTTGSYMLYSTYLGGGGAEIPTSLIVNNNNELLVLGTSGSANFPVTAQAYNTSFQGGTPYTLTSMHQFSSGSDLVISRLSVDGSNLLSSTYLGGSGNEGLNSFPPLKHNYADEARGEIKIDDNQNIYICSSTQSADFPTSTGVFQPTYGGNQDACVAKLDPTLTYLLWASYLGGSSPDAGYSLVIDDQERIYAAGGTASTDFPTTPGAYQPGFQGGGCDGFIACLQDNGTSLPYATYYGSTAYDQIYLIDRDKAENIYALGQTAATGSTFIFNVSWATPGGGQFITKFSPDLSGRQWSTAFGTGNGGPDLSPTAFMIDYCNYIYISGWGSQQLNGFGGTSGLPVTSNAFQTTTDNNDYYFLVLNGDVSQIIYATYFGGSMNEHVDGGTSRFDKKGKIYQSVCASCGGADDFPTTPGAWSNVNGSTNCNNAVIKFDFNIPLAVADFVHPPAGCAPYALSFQNTSQVIHPATAQYNWDFGDGGTSTAKNPSHAYALPGTYPVRLIVSDTGSCNLSDTTYQTVIVLGSPSIYLTDKHICPGETIQIGINPIPDPSLSYTWIPPLGLNNPAISNPMATPVQTTTFQLLVTNGLCSDTVKQTVNVYDLQLDAGNDTILCSNTAVLTAWANLDSLQYIWSSSPAFIDTLNSSLANNHAQITLSAQTATFYVMAFNDYCTVMDSVQVSFSILVSPAGGQDPLCPDSCNGVAKVSILGGIPPYQYLWSNGMTLDSISRLCAGTYTVSVTDSIQCLSIANIVLTDPPKLVIQPQIENIPCDEVCSGSILIGISGGTFPYTIAWDQGQTTELISQLCAGTYQVQVLDSHLCPVEGTYQVLVESIFQNIQVDVQPDTVYQGLSAQLNASPLPGCQYLWAPASTLNSPDIPNPLATPASSSMYYLTITDPFGCQYIDSVKVLVKEVICREPYIYMPNAFTPNRDFKNDILLVQSPYIESMNLSIYDRWGTKVFETSEQKIGWDGTWKGKECEQGVYVYYLEAGCYNKETFKKKGNITLIR